MIEQLNKEYKELIQGYKEILKEYSTINKDLREFFTPFNDVYFRGLTNEHIAELAKKSIRLTQDNRILEGGVERGKMKNIDEYVNKIINADCLDVLRGVPDKCVDLVVTDIPYDISVSHSAGAFGVKKRMHYKKELEIISNGISNEILEELCRVMKKINIYIFCSKKQFIQMLEFFVKERNCNWQIITWHKTNVIPSCGNSYMPDTEYCLFFREKGVYVGGTPKTKNTYYITQTNKADKKLYGHPTIKPEKIIENFIINSSNENDIVLDPYCGSGTIPVVSYKLNRKYIGIEIVEKYCKVSNERLQIAQAQQKIKFEY